MKEQEGSRCEDSMLKPPKLIKIVNPQPPASVSKSLSCIFLCGIFNLSECRIIG